MKGIYFASFYFRVWDLTREICENKNPAKISTYTVFDTSFIYFLTYIFIFSLHYYFYIWTLDLYYGHILYTSYQLSSIWNYLLIPVAATRFI